jgi:ribose transport system permease protein
MVDLAKTDSPTTRTATHRSASVLRFVERAAVPLALLIIVVVFSTLPATGGTFLTGANIRNILANQSVTGLIALGMLIPLVANYFDLSTPAIAGVASVAMAALAATHQQSVWLALIAGVLFGLVAGALNGLLISVIRLNPMISTLGTYILLGGLLQLYTGGQTILGGMPESVGSWGSQVDLGLPRPFWLLMAVSGAVWFLLTQTPFGRRLAAIGSNETAARLAGIRVGRAVFITYLLSALLGGIAGVLLTSRSGSANATNAISYLFPALAAVFLGQTSINPGRYNVWGTIFGVFLVAVAVNGFTILGAAAWVTPVFNGAALLLSVAASTLLQRSRENRARKAVFRAMQNEAAPSGPIDVR